MLNEVLLYAIAVLGVIFLMAPSNHPNSYTGRPSAIEVEAQVIEDKVDFDEEIEYPSEGVIQWIDEEVDEVHVDTEWVLDFVWPDDEEVEEVYPTEGVLQWVDEEIEDVELDIAVEVREKPILLLPAAKEVEPVLPTKKGVQPKGFGKPKKGKTKKKK